MGFLTLSLFAIGTGAVFFFLWVCWMDAEAKANGYKAQEKMTPEQRAAWDEERKRRGW